MRATSWKRFSRTSLPISVDDAVMMTSSAKVVRRSASPHVSVDCDQLAEK